jgi:hypothetical protein
MSLASSSSYSVAGSAVKQQGVLTFVAGQTCTVPCKSLTATDYIGLLVINPTAGSVPAGGTQLTNNLFTITITAGTGFTVVGRDAAFAGTVSYVVLANSLPDVNITSA